MTPASSELEAFDFQKHRADAVEKYKTRRGLYEAFSGVVREVLRASIPPAYQIHSIDARAKDPESFGDKAARPSDDDSNKPKYSDPLEQITDLAGTRVIVFFPKILARVDEVVTREFDVIERTDKADELIASDKFGYQSIHYLVKLKSSRTSLPEYERYANLVAEIQVRTILQHAWAEMEHDIQYKSAAAMPPLIRRRFMSLAGMLEIADREFQAVQDEDERVRAQVREDATLDPIIRTTPTIVRTEPTTVESRPTATNYVTGSARALLERGLYADAVRAYNEVVEKHPGVHTNYIGRARARFLAGDRDGALGDLAVADSLCPSDPVIQRLRQQIGEGVTTFPANVFSLPGHDEVVEANARLASGDHIGALDKYAVAQSAGWLGVYSKFNRAMAHCLGGEADVTLDILNTITPEPGSFMEVNVNGLRAVVRALSGAAPEMQQEDLTRLANLQGLAEFTYYKSPLRFLEDGLRKVGNLDKAAVVFALLNRNRSK